MTSDRCLFCSAEIADGGKYCGKCMAKLHRYADTHESAAPALHGLSDGPGTKSTHYCKPNAYKEQLKAFKLMEEKGKFNHPKKVKRAQRILEKSKYITERTKPVDYQVDGHPVFDKPIKKDLE